MMTNESPEPNAGAREEPPQRKCANCSRVLAAGDFCPRCGQRQRRERLSFSGVLRQFADDAFSLHRGFLHTLVALSRRPGEVVRDFVHGRTVPYTSPTRYFLICLAVAQLVAFWTQGIQGLSEGLIGGPGEASAGAAEGSRLIRSYFVLMSAGALPIVVIATRLFFAGSQFNFAEHTVFHLYIGGHSAFVFAAVGVFSSQLPAAVGVPLFVLSLLALVFYYIASAVTFFSVSKIRAACCIVLSIALGILTWGFFLVLLTASLRTTP